MYTTEPFTPNSFAIEIRNSSTSELGIELVTVLEIVTVAKKTRCCVSSHLRNILPRTPVKVGEADGMEVDGVREGAEKSEIILVEMESEEFLLRTITRAAELPENLWRKFLAVSTSTISRAAELPET